MGIRGGVFWAAAVGDVGEEVVGGVGEGAVVVVVGGGGGGWSWVWVWG